MISHSVIIITKGKEEEGVKVREEEGKACCSFKAPGLPILCEPQALGGAFIEQTATATHLCNPPAGRPTC
jgi:hypothetical protein